MVERPRRKRPPERHPPKPTAKRQKVTKEPPSSALTTDVMQIALLLRAEAQDASSTKHRTRTFTKGHIKTEES